jgi:glutaredoxin
MEMVRKRKVEVFVAGCPLCKDAVKLIKETACPNWEVKIYDLREKGMDKAKKYGVNSVPAVVVDGKILDCCKRGKITKRDLVAAGIGIPRKK